MTARHSQSISKRLHMYTSMFFRCFQAERKKLRHSILFPACIFIPVIPAIMGTFNYLQNTEILKEQWYSLWTQLTLFYAAFFFAPLTALYCSYLWRLEHRNNNWNVFMSVPASIPCLYFGKLAVVLSLTLITQCWIGILYIASGKLVGLPGSCPPQIIFWLLRGTFAAAAVGALQLLLSMLIRSFSVPIGIALTGSVIGMLISNKSLGPLCPYSLMLIGMNSNKTVDSMSESTLIFVVAVLLFFLLFSMLAVYILRTKDIYA